MSDPRDEAHAALAEYDTGSGGRFSGMSHRLAAALRALLDEPVPGDDAEWEYHSVMVDEATGDDWDEVEAESLEDALRMNARWIAENGGPEEGVSLIVRRRRKAGPWEPVDPEADRR